MCIRILLADDHQIVLDGLRALIQKQTNMEVIAEAIDGRGAVALAKTLQPDLIVMDISMSGMNGIEAAQAILKTSAKPKIVALSIHKDKRFISKMLLAGASGYLLKDCAFEELIKAVNAVMSGKIYLSSEIDHLIVEEYLGLLRKDVSASSKTLTSREKEILQMISEGKTTKEIASDLFLSVKTVESHRKNIMEKLRIDNVAELTKYALREGLTTL